ncbi:MAG: hypothetical protein ACLFPR_17060 [Desulfococcaceae bacterium]
MSEVAPSAFRRAGVLVIEKSDELFPAAETLASLPVVRNNKVAILADGGDHATYSPVRNRNWLPPKNIIR